ncbi:MAG TPA: YidB family protein [Xanthobacteraceae bacterium]|nr:YidB family protein [Xanthobacteraceae bacterium]
MSDIFGGILGTALRGLAGQGGTGALSDILSQVLARTDLGSIGGLLQQLQQSGLGAEVASWLGNGANLPISVDQLKNALGDQRLRQLATQLGLPVDQLLDQLSQHLPGAIDHMSPHGTLEEQLGPG